jgi:hypothetical protein
MNVQLICESFHWQRFRFVHVAIDVRFGADQDRWRDGTESASLRTLPISVTARTPRGELFFRSESANF